MHFLFRKGGISLASVRRDIWLSIDIYLWVSISISKPILASKLPQSIIIHFKAPTPASWSLSLPFCPKLPGLFQLRGFPPNPAPATQPPYSPAKLNIQSPAIPCYSISLALAMASLFLLLFAGLLQMPLDIFSFSSSFPLMEQPFHKFPLVSLLTHIVKINFQPNKKKQFC